MSLQLVCKHISVSEDIYCNMTHCIAITSHAVSWGKSIPQNTCASNNKLMMQEHITQLNKMQ